MRPKTRENDLFKYEAARSGTRSKFKDPEDPKIADKRAVTLKFSLPIAVDDCVRQGGHHCWMPPELLAPASVSKMVCKLCDDRLLAWDS